MPAIETAPRRLGGAPGVRDPRSDEHQRQHRAHNTSIRNQRCVKLAGGGSGAQHGRRSRS